MKIYLDTSIISAYFDMSKPVRQLMTVKWLQNEAAEFDLYISTLVIAELSADPDERRRENMLNLVRDLNLTVLELQPTAVELAATYRRQIIPNEVNDSLHIALATVSGIDAIVSWNFRHIVNVKTMKAVHEINLANAYQTIEIVSVENLGGEKYGSI